MFDIHPLVNRRNKSCSPPAVGERFPIFQFSNICLDVCDELLRLFVRIYVIVAVTLHVGLRWAASSSWISMEQPFRKGLSANIMQRPCVGCVDPLIPRWIHGHFTRDIRKAYIFASTFAMSEFLGLCIVRAGFLTSCEEISHDFLCMTVAAP